MRAIALVLVILTSIEMADKLGEINIKKGFLLVAIIITLPDVSDIFLSGKHDGYVFLFELTGINTICLSILAKNKLCKISLLFLAIFIGLISVTLRLSSLTFLFLSIALFLYYLLKFSLSSILNECKFIIDSIPKIFLIFLFGTIGSTLIIPFLNLHYLDNPLYFISPPGFLKNIFPNAIYRLDYKVISESLSLRNIPLILKPITTILYASFGAEPIRYGLNKFRESNNLFFIISNYLNFIGPQEMMVSMLSLSPFTILPYLDFNNLQSKKRVILFFLTTWILLWSISIPYTRVAMASSISLVIFAISEPFKIQTNIKKINIPKAIKNFIIFYGLFSIFLFSIWNFSRLYDLPISSLLKNEKYSRTVLTRDFIQMQNKNLNQSRLIPSKKFEEDWGEIEKNNAKDNLFLIGAPSQFRYFMRKGLLTNPLKNAEEHIEKNLICFEVNEKQEIIKRNC